MSFPLFAYPAFIVSLFRVVTFPLISIPILFLPALLGFSQGGLVYRYIVLLLGTSLFADVSTAGDISILTGGED